MGNSTTAIIIFSRTAAAETTCKPFFCGNGTANFKMWDYLYQKTLRIAKETGLPLIICNEHTQKGVSFGEKMANALSSGFDLGYKNLIVIGGDCPDLNMATLLKVNRQINSNNDVVFGPDSRGGVYLFAINKSVFSETAFTNFAWQTRQLIKHFKQYVTLFSVVILSRLGDINTIENVIASLNKFTISNSWRLLLSQIIATNNVIYNCLVKIYRSLYLNSNKPLRAPPLF